MIQFTAHDENDMDYTMIDPDEGFYLEFTPARDRVARMNAVTHSCYQKYADTIADRHDTFELRPEDEWRRKNGWPVYSVVEITEAIK